MRSSPGRDSNLQAATSQLQIRRSTTQPLAQHDQHRFIGVCTERARLRLLTTSYLIIGASQGQTGQGIEAPSRTG